MVAALFAAVFTTSTSFAQIKSATLSAAGLTCAMCSKAINTALEEIEYVSSVKADIKNSAFIVQFKEGAGVNLDDLKNAVEDAGFSVAVLKIDADFGSSQIKNDTHLDLDGKTYHFVSVEPQLLEGKQTFTVVDKNFITAKRFKKYAATTKMSCIETGKMESCCSKDLASTRIYHLTR